MSEQFLLPFLVQRVPYAVAMDQRWRGLNKAVATTMESAQLDRHWFPTNVNLLFHTSFDPYGLRPQQCSSTSSQQKDNTRRKPNSLLQIHNNTNWERKLWNLVYYVCTTFHSPRDYHP